MKRAIDFVVCKFGVLLFLHHQDTLHCPVKIWSPDLFVLKGSKKNKKKNATLIYGASVCFVSQSVCIHFFA